MTRLGVALLALLAYRLSRRDSSWRPLTLSLALLAIVDAVRLWTGPLAAARTPGWWQLDVALCALWPAYLGVGLLPAAGHFANARRVHAGAESLGLTAGEPLFFRALRHLFTPVLARRSFRDHVAEVLVRLVALRSKSPVPSRAVGEHVPMLPRLLALALFAVAIGAARPWLPRLAYLSALCFPRWALAALWLEAMIVAWKRSARSVSSPTSPVYHSGAPAASSHPPSSWASPARSRTGEGASELPAHEQDTTGTNTQAQKSERPETEVPGPSLAPLSRTEVPNNGHFAPSHPGPGVAPLNLKSPRPLTGAHSALTGGDCFDPESTPIDGDAQAQKSEGPGSLPAQLPRSVPHSGERRRAVEGVVPCGHRVRDGRLAQACALILCGGHAVNLVAGSWASWEAPTWGYARFVTWIVYTAVGAVMVREIRCSTAR